mmetsp:Transcript_13658/g.19980  ORF Transcript_13658/g.19980 Transcript_13658/m.19980 type:complete len:93 (-) Transcript_13658:958-1236(-)
MNLDPAAQRKLEQNVVNITMKQNIQMLNDLVDECFGQCVFKFPSKILDKEERVCLKSCSDRYIALAQRVGTRYSEYQAAVVKEEKLKKQTKA